MEAGLTNVLIPAQALPSATGQFARTGTSGTDFLPVWAAIRAGPIRALGSYLGCATAKRTEGQG
jgi:hypothetical protein